MKGFGNTNVGRIGILAGVLLATDLVAQENDSQPRTTIAVAHEYGSRRGERIETDRHDFTQAPTTVGAGVFQLESGYSFFRKSEAGETETSHTLPEAMLRIGLTEDLEFRIRYNQVWQFGENEDRSGAEDLRLSLKYRMSDQDCWIPESAVEFRFAVPTGARDWSTEDYEYGIDYIYGWRLTEQLELYGSTGFATNGLGDFSFRPDDPANEDFLVYWQSIAIGWEMTESSTIYAEFFGLFTNGFEDDEQSPVFFNVGVDYYVSHDFVLDVRAGNGLNDDADDFFCGIGGGYRF